MRFVGDAKFIGNVRMKTDSKPLNGVMDLVQLAHFSGIEMVQVAVI